MDSRTDLQQPVLDGGIRSINFFNGRLLSANDLTREQSASREADRRLGKAVGEGVAYGLEVSQLANGNNQSPAVSVEAGLAVNRRGQTLMLEARTDIALVRTVDATGSSQGFAECAPLQTGAYVSGAGVYLLTIAPAQQTEGRAITNGMNPTTATCNSDTIVSCVQFRLIQIDPPITTAEMQDEGHLRNLLAYKCFGTEETNTFITDPFGKALAQWGLLDGLRPNQLTDCEVPLAVLCWTDAGIDFIDMWSVRRRLASSQNGEWPPFESDAAMAMAEARLLQFRDQIDDLRSPTANAAQLRALDIFDHLPPAGLLPTDSAISTGFNLEKFFDGMTVRNPVFIDVAQVEDLLRASQRYGAIDVSNHEVIWLYQVRENVLGNTSPYAIFANGHIPPIGLGRFNLGRWNYSNYAIL
ncbi:MAG TPA: hypothetical protein VHP99_02435 [Pyrinomonadaceae bacterium]|jgi:hypothetical protein|nr:hypothetical protein [Pyrinomonadaceae bacterium]